MSETCHVYEWVTCVPGISHRRTRCVTRMNTCVAVCCSATHMNTYGAVRCSAWISVLWRVAVSHITCADALCHAHEYVCCSVLQCHTHESVRCRSWTRVLQHLVVGHITYADALCHTHALWKRQYSAKETYNFKEPTHRNHPIFEIWSPVWAVQGHQRSARCSTWMSHNTHM